MGEITKETADFDKLADIIKSDVGLSASTLKLINSAYFGLPHQVGTASHAIVLLGIEGMRKEKGCGGVLPCGVVFFAGKW